MKTQNEDRNSYKVKAHFNSQEVTIPFITCSSDIGVIRNGGRNGARYAPRSILNQFKNLVYTYNNEVFASFEVADQKLEKSDFNKAQEHEASTTLNYLKQLDEKSKLSKLIHIGGGHDHIYPLLDAAQKHKYTKIYVLNIDAHCDTRTDQDKHSGTPFRQFDEQTNCTFKMIQFGIQPYANSQSTLKPLRNTCEILDFNQTLQLDHQQLESKLKEFFDSWEENAMFILSLDCDAIASSTMEAVSAVAHQGISTDTITNIVKIFNQLEGSATKVLGIYEHNPIYDNLNCKGSRFISALIHEFIK